MILEELGKEKNENVKLKFKLENNNLKLIGYEYPDSRVINSINYTKYDEHTGKQIITYDIKDYNNIKTINKLLENSIPDYTTTGVGLNDTIIFNYADGTNKRIVFMSEKCFVTDISNMVYCSENDENLKDILSNIVK